MSIKSLEQLFVNELSAIYDAEKQITVALPKMIAAATNPELKAAFETHLEETRGQIARIEEAASAEEIKLEQQLCTVMQALIRESEIMIKIVPPGPLLDLALISGAQKVEHHEIAAYTSLVNMAVELEFDDAADLLEVTLEEETATDEKLSGLAEQEFETKLAALPPGTAKNLGQSNV
jgi:ferritin-like metal-binding protein YciE